MTEAEGKNNGRESQNENLGVFVFEYRHIDYRNLHLVGSFLYMIPREPVQNSADSIQSVILQH